MRTKSSLQRATIPIRSDQARLSCTFHHKHAVSVAAFDEILKKLWQFPDALVALTDP